MRIRLLHLPVELPRERAPRGSFVNVMPMGLLGLADALDRGGHQVEVVHAGVERRLDPDFSVNADLRAHPVDLLGLSLHWHHQLGPIVRVLEELRDLDERPQVVVGGMTASAFPRELLEHFPALDFVLVGEAERGLVELVGLLDSGNGDRAAVTNLCYREVERIHLPAERRPATSAEFDALSFARFDLLRHQETENSQFAEDAAGRFAQASVYYVPTGRGCTQNCAFCAGGQRAHEHLAGRERVILRNPERVARDIERAVHFGRRTLCFCFDPPPGSEPFHRALFDCLGVLGNDLGCVFECYRPPSEALLDALARTFAPGRVRISLSPTVGDEALRAQLLTFAYDNRSVEETLQRACARGIATTLYFAVVPQESAARHEASLAWQLRLREAYGCRLIHAPLEIEPRAPWEQDPEAHGLVAPRRAFSDLLVRHEQGSIGACYAGEVGYRFEAVDVRVVRAASMALDPRTELAHTLAWCGSGARELRVIAAAGRAEEAWGVVAEARDRTALVIAHDPPPADGECGLARRAAQAGGARARLVLADPAGVIHQRWDGREPLLNGSTTALHALHLDDAKAARRALWEVQTFPRPGADHVLVGSCRWSLGPCPARRPGLVAIGGDGAWRACPYAPPADAPSPAALVALAARRALEVEMSRGCASCPVADRCSRCLFTGGIPERDFCAIIRYLSGGPLTVPPPPTRPIAIGWDD